MGSAISGQAAGGIASIAGGLFGASGGNDLSNPADTGAMNDLLSSGLTSGLNYSQAYTGQATSALNSGLSAALQSLATAGSTLASYGQQATNASTTAYNQEQAANTPMRVAGYNALDSYEDSLGMVRPKVGNAALAQSLLGQATTQGMLNTYQSQNGQLDQYYVNGGNPYYSNANNGQPTDQYGAPIAPTNALLAAGISPSQLNNYINQNTTISNGKDGQTWYTFNGGEANAPAYDPNDPTTAQAAAAGVREGGGAESNTVSGGGLLSPGQAQLIYSNLGQQNMTGALSAYNMANQTYGNLGTQLQYYTPQQQAIANAYNKGLFSTPTSRSNLY